MLCSLPDAIRAGPGGRFKSQHYWGLVRLQEESVECEDQVQSCEEPHSKREIVREEKPKEWRKDDQEQKRKRKWLAVSRAANQFSKLHGLRFGLLGMK